MIERRKIVELWHRGSAAVLVTLVRVEGSSYRKAGARLLIAKNGEYAGSLSGGCLEAEVIQKAQWKVRGGAVVERYSTMFDDTADIPYGLGCGGTVDLLFEPADTAEFTVIMQALEASLGGRDVFVSTVLPNGSVQLARRVDSSPMTISGLEDQGCFTEVLEPPQRLFVFGAGDDARPVVKTAALLGWNVIVADGRSQWATSSRFPEAAQVIAHLPDKWRLEITGRDAVVVMTHSFEQDREWLCAAMKASPRYLGLLGARHRSALLVSETAARLDWPLARACEHLFAPVGLDLGGDGAEAIALAMVAEIQAFREGKLGHSRRMDPETIAEQVALGGGSRYLQMKCAI